MTDIPPVIPPRLTRRRFLGLSFGAVLAGGIPLQASTRVLAQTTLDRAYLFLDLMLDKYATGQTPRLAQSYIATDALDLGDTAFVYDNAVMLHAFLKRGDLTRAGAIGNALLLAQQKDPNFNDGRLRNAYHASSLVSSGNANVANSGTYTGNMAWAGLALTALYARTHTSRYLSGAEAIGTWISSQTNDPRGAGGFTGGVSDNGTTVTWKSTEHNIDALAFFRALGSYSTAADWAALADHAQAFVESMWEPASGHFWPGTRSDGVAINIDFVPEDIQSWSYLALRNPAYAPSLDWAVGNLSANDPPFKGVSFSNNDRSGVWFEGTSHLALALLLRNGKGDSARARSYLQNLRLAQKGAPNTDGEGIVAASHDGLGTGDGDSYFAALHTGTTAWYGLTALRTNPLAS